MSLRVSNIDAVPLITKREPFRSHTGHLRGEKITPGCYLYSTGMLPSDEQFKEGLERASYVVYSYATPIGWYADGTWYVPNVKYSISTSSHQGRLRWALNEEPVKYLGPAEERKQRRQPSSTGGGWGS